MQCLRLYHCFTRIFGQISSRRGAVVCFKGENLCNNARTFSSCKVPSLIHRSRCTPFLKYFPTSCTEKNWIYKNCGITSQSFIVSHVKFSSSSLSDSDIKKAIETLSDQFMEARELLDDARESFGTVYFSEDMKDAQAAVEETLTFYDNLLSQLNSEQRQVVLQSVGLKMEELKAQEQAIKEQLHDD